MPKQPQSEMAEKATNLIKAVDKLVRDVRRDKAAVLKAIQELKGKGADEEKKSE